MITSIISVFPNSKFDRSKVFPFVLWSNLFEKFVVPNSSIMIKFVRLASKNKIQRISKQVRCMSSNSFKIQNEEDFEERVLKSSTPVIVDFMAT